MKILQPRHLITIIALIIVAILALKEVIAGEVAVTMIVGVLVSYGTYQLPSPNQKKQ